MGNRAILEIKLIGVKLLRQLSQAGSLLLLVVGFSHLRQLTTPTLVPEGDKAEDVVVAIVPLADGAAGVEGVVRDKILGPVDAAWTQVVDVEAAPVTVIKAPYLP